jgi:hypothetical protein
VIPEVEKLLFRIDFTRDIGGSGEVDPWEFDQSTVNFGNYDDLEKPVSGTMPGKNT